MNEQNPITTKASASQLKAPFVLTLVGILLMAAAMFLPYLNATGDLAEAIADNPNAIESRELGITSGDLAEVAFVSMGDLFAVAYSEEDGTVAKVFIGVIAGLLALGALFALVKKPIAAAIFTLAPAGIFLFFSSIVKDPLISPDGYAWGIGYYAFLVAAVAAFVGAIWMFVVKRAIKRQA